MLHQPLNLLIKRIDQTLTHQLTNDHFSVRINSNFITLPTPNRLTILIDLLSQIGLSHSHFGTQKPKLCAIHCPILSNNSTRNFSVKLSNMRNSNYFIAIIINHRR